MMMTKTDYLYLEIPAPDCCEYNKNLAISRGNKPPTRMVFTCLGSVLLVPRTHIGILPEEDQEKPVEYEDCSEENKTEIDKLFSQENT